MRFHCQEHRTLRTRLGPERADPLAGVRTDHTYSARSIAPWT